MIRNKLFQSRLGYVSSGIALGLFFLLGYVIDRNQTIPLVFCLAVLFSFYAFWISNADRLPLKHFLIFAALFRLIFAFSVPSLSDDYFRFIWDGILWLNGINPFTVTPAEALVKLDIVRLNEIYPQVYGKNYSTVYPPMAQSIFWISAAVSSDLIHSVLVLRFFIFLFEVGIIWLIWRILRELRLPRHLILIYALNPLVILEFSGNLHHEAYVIFFLAATIFLLVRRKEFFASVTFSGAVLSKLLPLIFLPSIFFAYNRKSAFKMIVIIFLMSLTGFLLMGGEKIIDGFDQGVSLYYQKFEFNPSIWFLVRALGQQITGYNVLIYAGPILAVISGLLIIGLSKDWQLKILDGFPLQVFADKWMILLTIYLIFSPIVHPWYMAPLIFFSVFGSYKYPLLWSGLIMMTYSGYQISGYHEQPWILLLEYAGVLLFFLFEWNRRRAKVS